MATLNIEIDVPIPVGQMIYVDSVVGTSGGERGRFDKPFATPTQAKAVAVAGDLIHVGPGSYALSSNLSKDGVNWYFEQGATVTLDQTGEFGIFDDETIAASFSVGGFGEFVMNTNTEDHAFVGAFKTSHASSNIQVHAKSILLSNSAGDPSDSACAVNGARGTLIVECTDFIQSDTIGYCIYWENGPMHVTAPNIIGGANGAITSTCTTTPTGKLWVRADQIATTAAGSPTPCVADNSSEAAQVWIEALEIRNEADGNCIYTYGAAKVYITAQKISAVDGQNAILQAGTNTTWITAQKITGGSRFAKVDSGTLYLNCMDFEDPGAMTAGIEVTGGTLVAKGGNLVMSTGDGVLISGGTARFNGTTVEILGGSGIPVNNTGGTIEGDLFYDDGTGSTGNVSTLNADGTWSWAALTASDVGADPAGSAAAAQAAAIAASVPVSATINDQTGTTYTLALVDANSLVRLSNAAAIALTVPANATVAFPIGTRIQVQQAGAGQVTVAGAGAAAGNVNSFGGALKSAGQYARFELIKTGTDRWSIEGNLTP